MNDLATFGRVEQRARKEIDIADIARVACRMVHHELCHRANLVLQLGSTPRVIGDPARRSQVLVRLLVDAAHALDDEHQGERRVLVRSFSDRGGTTLVVEDTRRGRDASPGFEVCASIVEQRARADEAGERRWPVRGHRGSGSRAALI